MITAIRRPKRILALTAGLLSVVLSLVAVPGAAAASSAPPFPECPAIGQASSCEILLVVNPNQTISVIGDPAVGPYDGIDDTLVGIINNSTGPVPAITVSGPGTDLAGFDGDGICTYAKGGGNGPGFTGDGYCTPQQIAGSDPEDYAGPGTSFTLDPSSQDEVEVDFAGTGLAAGHSTYFSLEGALTAAVITARKGKLDLGEYVALGDSYSSGEGNPPFIQPDTGCDRSVSAAWPELVAGMFGVNLEALLACSGATTSALYQGYKQQLPQLQALAKVGVPPNLVTVTMGGDDLGFSLDFGACFVGIEGGCAAALGRVEIDLADGFGQRMTTDFKRIKASAPTANVVVVGYPQIISGNPISLLRHCPLVGVENEGLIRAVGKQLDSILGRAAAAAGVGYVSTLNALKGHELCTAQPWINSAYSGPTSGRGHPNAHGQALIAGAVEDYVVLHHLLPGV
jgi:lysophospholipase L1-like esterase